MAALPTLAGWCLRSRSSPQPVGRRLLWPRAVFAMIPYSTARRVKRLLAARVPQRQIAKQCDISRGTVLRIKFGTTKRRRPPPKVTSAVAERMDRIRLLLRGLAILIRSDRVEPLGIRLQRQHQERYEELHARKLEVAAQRQAKADAAARQRASSHDDAGDAAGPSDEFLRRLESPQR